MIATTMSTTGMTASHHHCRRFAYHLPPPALDGSAAGGAFGTSWPGTSRPDSPDARLAGSVVNLFVDLSQVIAPPLNFCVTRSPFSVWSAVGAPRSPFAPPSLVHAAFIAPR